jgi:DNA polymerase-3 subunit gamma/tau
MQVGKAASGSLRDSLSLLDQAIAHGGGKVTASDVTDMLGTLGGDLVWPLLERIAEGDGKGTIAEAQRIASRSVSMEAVLEDIAALLHRVALAQAGAGNDDEEDSARVNALASRLDAGRVQVMYQVAVLGRRDMPLAPDEYAGFTMTLLRMLSFNGSQGQAMGRVEPVAMPRPTPAAKPAASPSATPAASTAKSAATPGAPASSPAAAGNPAAAPSAVAFDGDWPGLVQRLRLTGMAGMAARNAEFVSLENNHLELVVPESQRMYAEKPYVDKLKADLAPHFGANLRITVKVGSISGNTVAAARSREVAQKQANAAEAIEDDPFVRDLVRDLGAEVVPSSIRPLDEGGR